MLRGGTHTALIGAGEYASAVSFYTDPDRLCSWAAATRIREGGGGVGPEERGFCAAQTSFHRFQHDASGHRGVGECSAEFPVRLYRGPVSRSEVRAGRELQVS